MVAEVRSYGLVSPLIVIKVEVTLVILLELPFGTRMPLVLKRNLDIASFVGNV